MTSFRETLDVDGWIWMPVGDRGYMIDAVNRSSKERYRVLVRDDGHARAETSSLRSRGFEGTVVL